MSSLQIESGWKKVLDSEVEKPYFLEIKKFLKSEIKSGKQVFPLPNDIFSALNLCPWDKVKVVILGQDPYHSSENIDEKISPHAHGLSFSIPKLNKKIPPSLQNIYKELKTDLSKENFQIPNHGNLKKWADQGVLMLNATLTVQAGMANSHSDIGWQNFTDYIIQAVSEYHENIVFILWGKFAQGKSKFIDPKKHLIIQSPHPSPFSAYSGFFGSKCFSKTNNYLDSKGIKPINWSDL